MKRGNGNLKCPPGEWISKWRHKHAHMRGLLSKRGVDSWCKQLGWISEDYADRAKPDNSPQAHPGWLNFCIFQENMKHWREERTIAVWKESWCWRGIRRMEIVCILIKMWIAMGSCFCWNRLNFSLRSEHFILFKLYPNKINVTIISYSSAQSFKRKYE